MESQGKSTAEKLKAEILARGYTLKEFAGKMRVAYGTLVNTLNGHSPLTPALQNHIEMALQLDNGKATPPPAPAAPPAGITREGVIIYKIEIPDGRLDEICTGLTSPADRAAALERVVHYNLRELVELGKTCEWTDEERRQLGI